MDSACKCFDCSCWRCFNVFCPHGRCDRACSEEDNCFCSDCKKAVFIFSKEEAVQIIEEYTKRKETDS